MVWENLRFIHGQSSMISSLFIKWWELHWLTAKTHAAIHTQIHTCVLFVRVCIWLHVSWMYVILLIQIPFMLIGYKSHFCPILYTLSFVNTCYLSDSMGKVALCALLQNYATYFINIMNGTISRRRIFDTIFNNIY